MKSFPPLAPFPRILCHFPEKVIYVIPVHLSPKTLSASLVHQMPMRCTLQVIVVALIVTPCSGLDAPGARRRKLLDTSTVLCKPFDFTYGGSMFPMGESDALSAARSARPVRSRHAHAQPPYSTSAASVQVGPSSAGPPTNSSAQTAGCMSNGSCCFGRFCGRPSSPLRSSSSSR